MTDTYTREQIVRKLRKLLKTNESIRQFEVVESRSDFLLGKSVGLNDAIAAFQKGKEGK